jgi:amino acid adenylation domain-containing protein
VADSGTALSYSDLARATNRLACGLRNLGVRAGDRVAFCLERSTRPVVAALAALKADAAYVPVHRQTPPERMAAIFSDCSPQVVVCDASTLPPVESALRIASVPSRVVALGVKRPSGGAAAAPEIYEDDLERLDDAPLAYRNAPSANAYLLYTSGSTGRPKGVLVTHRNVRDYIDWAAKMFEVGPSDRVLGTAPFSFDMSTFDIYCPLKAGAALYVVPEMALTFPSRLIQFMERHEVTVWKGVASLLMYMARTGALAGGRIPSLRTVIFGGEALPAKYLIEWMRTFPEKTFFNAYGPTETTGVSACYRVPAVPGGPEEAIPIGKPRDGTELLVLNEEGSAVPQGQPGEICIRGAGVGPGYWNDEELSRRAFREMAGEDGSLKRAFMTGDRGMLRPDGHCVYLGRIDAQVKVMGYRIELADIERVLVSLGWVRDAAVVLSRAGSDGLPELIAFVDMDESRCSDEVRRELAARLPAYMVPRKVVALPGLPRTDRGKVDRQNLLSGGHANDPGSGDG